eukprot:1207632-Prymnesium_polylepis.1
MNRHESAKNVSEFDRTSNDLFALLPEASRRRPELCFLRLFVQMFNTLNAFTMKARARPCTPLLAHTAQRARTHAPHPLSRPSSIHQRSPPPLSMTFVPPHPAPRSQVDYLFDHILAMPLLPAAAHAALAAAIEAAVLPVDAGHDATMAAVKRHGALLDQVNGSMRRPHRSHSRRATPHAPRHPSS